VHIKSDSYYMITQEEIYRELAHVLLRTPSGVVQVVEGETEEGGKREERG